MDISEGFRMDRTAKMMVASALTKIYSKSKKVVGWTVDVPVNETEPVDLYYTAITKSIGGMEKVAVELKSRPPYTKDSYGGEGQEGWIVEDRKINNLRYLINEKGYDKGLYVFLTGDNYMRVFDIDKWTLSTTTEKCINYYTVNPDKGSRMVVKKAVSNDCCVWEGYI